MVSIILRLLPYIILISAFVGGIAWIVDASYEHGRKMERLEWIERDEISKHQADIRITQLEKKMQADQDKADRRATQIFGAYANEIEKLHNDLVDATDHRLYITAKASNCKADRSAMPSSNESTGSNGGEIRFEIQETLAREISGDYYAAAGLEIKFNTLADLIKSRPDCFEVVE